MAIRSLTPVAASRRRRKVGGLLPGLCLALAALHTPAQAQVKAESAGDELSRYQRTIMYLRQTHPDEQTDFAVAALAELVAVYIAEADLARSQAAGREGAGRARLLGWSQAVDQYASQLLRMLNEVENDSPISLRLGLQGPATITVTGLAVILGHPRADQQAAFEHRVLTDFCSRQDCQRMTATVPESEPIPITLALASPSWAFTESGPVCSIDELQVHFGTTDNLGMLRGICEQLAQELAALASDLAWQKRHGVEIAWQAIAISSTPGRPEHLVRLNGAGDSSLLTIPLLFSSPVLFADVRPWLYARAKGDNSASTHLDAANYGWVPPGP